MRDGRSQCSQQGPVDAATEGKKHNVVGDGGAVPSPLCLHGHSAGSVLRHHTFCLHLQSMTWKSWGLRPPAPPLADLVLVPPGEQGTSSCGMWGRADRLYLYSAHQIERDLLQGDFCKLGRYSSRLSYLYSHPASPAQRSPVSLFALEGH